MATTFGYGPRFQHSTGQEHKGGAPNGRFLQLVNVPKATLSIPEASYDFTTLIDAAAAGNLQTLRSHGLAAERVVLEGDLADAIRALTARIAGLLRGLRSELSIRRSPTTRWSRARAHCRCARPPLVIFGAMGDLASRKLLPAIYNLAHEGALPERIALIGISRSEMTDEEFRDQRARVDRPLLPPASRPRRARRPAGEHLTTSRGRSTTRASTPS